MIGKLAKAKSGAAIGKISSSRFTFFCFKAAVLVGNITDGFKLYGPFKNIEEAELWRDQNVAHFNSWVMFIRNPGTYKENENG